ncbi:hypothetical protein K492DRAFT_211634 [Lichtheimia hyalospora FSU 10163]|nr:hypothetical protein K492DRAFT_211634 [Lichtheimia hyalospora FSU 10163]
MAFAQRRKVYKSQTHLLDIETSSQSDTSLCQSSKASQSSSPTSEGWHVISSVMESGSSLTSEIRRDSTSTTFELSESDSCVSMRQSDSDSSDTGKQSSFVAISDGFTSLPAHDGTGTFIDDTQCLSDQSHDGRISAASFAKAVHQLLDNHSITSTSESRDNEFDSRQAASSHDGTMISPLDETVSSEMTYDHMMVPPFRPTITETYPIFSGDDTVSKSNSIDSDNNATKCGWRNLDSIPSHHPTIPGTTTSYAVFSTIWKQLCDITANILENDASASETMTSLVSEAALEGCLPFGSHLHMEFSGVHFRAEQL